MTSRSNQRQLTVAITSQDRGFQAGFDAGQRKVRSFDRELQRASQGGIRQMNSSLDVSVGKLKTLVGVVAAAAVGRKLAQWAVDVKDSAVSLNESINAINVAAGDGADKILKFGESAATSVGLAQSEFNQAVVPIVAQLQNFGFSAEEAADASIVLTQRAADLASVFNTDVSVALGAIQAALRGESDPIEKFGASISAARVESVLLAEGMVESKSAITDADKVMGRYKLLLEDTARVQGDFANTSDELANKSRIFEARLEDWKATVGQQVIPIFEELLDVGEDLLPVLDTLATNVVPALADAFIGFVNGLREIAVFFADLPDAIQTVSVAVGGLGAALAIVYANPVVAGLAAVAAGITIIGNNAKTNREEVNLFVKDLQELGEVQVPTIEATIGKIPQKDLDLLKQVGIEIETVQEALAEGTAGTLLSDLIADYYDPTTVRDFGIEIEQVLDTQDALVHQQNQYNDAQAETNRLRKEAGTEIALRQVEVLAQQTADLAYAESQAADNAGLTATQIDRLTEEYNELEKQLQGVADKYAGELTSSLTGYLDIFNEAPEIETTSADQLLTNLEARVGTIQRFTEGLSRLQDAGLFDLASQFASEGPESVGTLEAVIADIDAGGSTAFTLNETIAASQSEIGRWAQEMGIEFAAATQPLLDEGRAFGEQWAEAIAAGISEQQLDLLFTAKIVSGRGGGLLDGVTGGTGASGVEFRANGGPVVAGRAYIVGEGGVPELFTPSQSGHVTPMSAAGNTTTINATFAPVINGATSSAADLSRELVRKFREELDHFDAGARRPR